ncbi:hypothetical protein TNCT_330941 [Trichonephila clavata]|uniref:Uncharacterized protein n=1 Tax=Trichonephila clavata TaxID=2740835 RepID=A0A8X6KKA4_TRICU|nr:hypothetical protein TNCT_330941 [Trichonephila clavata]
MDLQRILGDMIPKVRLLFEQSPLHGPLMDCTLITFKVWSQLSNGVAHNEGMFDHEENFFAARCVPRELTKNTEMASVCICWNTPGEISHLCSVLSLLMRRGRTSL